MNTIRMFAFVAAVLITAFLFRVVADGFAFEEPAHAAIAAHPAAAEDGSMATAD